MSLKLKCYLIAMPIQTAGLILHTNHPFIGAVIVGGLVGGLIGLIDD